MRRPMVAPLAPAVAAWACLLACLLQGAAGARRAAPRGDLTLEGDGFAGQVELLVEEQERGTEVHQDCLVGAWGAPGPCSEKCGGGLRSYRRVVIRQQAGNGAACPPLIKASACNVAMCGSSKKEKEEKRKQDVAKLKMEQKDARDKLYKSSEKNVEKAQDKSMAVLKKALKNGRVGLQASNNHRYVHLVDTVAGELKAYKKDKDERDNLIEDQVIKKRERFEKHIIESVHGMKQLMGKPQGFDHNQLYRSRSFEAESQTEDAQEVSQKQVIITKYHKELKEKAKQEKFGKKVLAGEPGKGEELGEDSAAPKNATVKAKLDSPGDPDRATAAQHAENKVKVIKQVKASAKREDALEQRMSVKQAHVVAEETEAARAIEKKLDRNILNVELRGDVAREKHNKANLGKSPGMIKAKTTKLEDLTRLRYEEQQYELRIDKEREAFHVIDTNLYKQKQAPPKAASAAGAGNVTAAQQAKLTAATRKAKNEQLELKKEVQQTEQARKGVNDEYSKMKHDDDQIEKAEWHERTAKANENELMTKEKSQKSSNYIKLERQSKASIRIFKKTLKDVETKLYAARHAAAEARAKLKAIPQINALAAKTEKLMKAKVKKEGENAAAIAQAEAMAALKRLKAARKAAYLAQRKAAKVAREIASAPKNTIKGALMMQGHADTDAMRLRSQYETIKADTQAIIDRMPKGAPEDSGSQMEMAKQKGMESSQKAKAAKITFLKEKKLCDKLKNERDIACDSKKKGDEELGEDATPKGKGKAKGISRVCKRAKSMVKKACKNVQKSAALAEFDQGKALERAAYVAQMNAAQIAQKEAMGQASKKAVAEADMAAAEAVSKANSPPKLLESKTRMFSAKEVKKIVASEVRRHMRLTNSTKRTTNSTKGEKALRKQVDKDLEKGKGKRKKKAKKKIKGPPMSKEGKAKLAAKRAISKLSKKAAAVLHKAFLAQRNAAKIADAERQKQATPDMMVDADEAAAEAKKASHLEEERVADGMFCAKGRGKLLQLEKQLSTIKKDSKQIKKDIEHEIYLTQRAVRKACKKAKMFKRATKKAVKQAKKDAKKTKKNLKKVAKMKAKAKKKKAKLPRGMDGKADKPERHSDFKIIVAHGAITAKYIGPKVKYPKHIEDKLANMTFDNPVKNASDFKIRDRNNTLTAEYIDPTKGMKAAKKKALLEIETKKNNKRGGGTASGKNAVGKPLGPEHYQALLKVKMDKPKVDADKLDSSKDFISAGLPTGKPQIPWPELSVARQARREQRGPPKGRPIRVAPKKASDVSDTGRRAS